MALEHLKSVFSDMKKNKISDVRDANSEYSLAGATGDTVKSPPQSVDFHTNQHAVGFTTKLEHKTKTLFIGDTSLYRIEKEPQSTDKFFNLHASGFKPNQKNSLFWGVDSETMTWDNSSLYGNIILFNKSNLSKLDDFSPSDLHKIESFNESICLKSLSFSS